MATSTSEANDGRLGRVAFLGPVASFTHQATLQDFPEGSGYSYQACPTIKDIFLAVGSGEASHGIVPFENSTYGPVVDTFDLLAGIASSSLTVTIVAESYVAVHHALVGRRNTEITLADSPSLPLTAATASSAAELSANASNSSSQTPISSGTATPTPEEPSPRKPRTKPRVPLAHVKRVLSHPQAFGQCAAFLATYLRHAEKQETTSTAAAAANVAAHEGIQYAAIASEAAARARGLDILAEQIEDLAGNRTRFLTIRRSDFMGTAGPDTEGVSAMAPTAAVAGSVAELALNGTSEAGAETQAYKTLISFTLVPAAPPGALAEALAAFNTHGLSLTSIHSRPSGARAWDYVFFVECAGGAPGDNRVGGAMEVLRSRVSACFCHGRYPERKRARTGESEA